MKIFSPPPPPTPTVHSNCKSVMAGRTNDRELLAWARSNKTPALRAIDEGPKLFEDTIDKHACWSSCKLWEHRPRVPDLVNSSPPPHPLNWSLNPLEETRWMKIFSPPPPPTPTVHSNCKSVMAGRTNDRELLAWARSNKTPALRAIDEGPKLFEDTIDKHACWSSCKLWEHRPRVPDLVNSSPPPHPLNWSLNPLEETLLQPLQSYFSLYSVQWRAGK